MKNLSLNSAYNPVLSVLTAPRKGVSYLHRTLSRLDEEGGSDWPGLKCVHYDGMDIPPENLTLFPGWTHVPSDNPSKLNGTVIQTWKVLELSGGCDLLTTEDDIEPCKNALRALVNLDMTGIAAFSMYQTCLTMSPGIHVSRYAEMYPASLALWIPRDTVAWLLSYGLRQLRPDGNLRDASMAEVLRAEKWTYPSPNWVQHKGDVSSMGNGPGRVTPFFNPSHDALKSDLTRHEGHARGWYPGL